MTTYAEPQVDRRILTFEEMAAEWTGRESVRHLPGKHDQASHGRKGGGGGIGTVDDGFPAGWESKVTHGYGEGVVAMRGGTTVTVPTEGFMRTPEDWSKIRPEDERLAIAGRAAIAIARCVDPLYRSHPELADVNLDIAVTASLLGPHAAANMSTQEYPPPEGGPWKTGVVVRVRPDLFAPKPGDQPFTVEGSVMGKHPLGETAMKMAGNVDYLHGRAAEVDPVRATIVHEMGHVVDWTTSKSPSVDWNQSESDSTRLLSTLFTGSDGARMYETASDYAKTNHTEFFAEAFSEWEMRGVAEPSEAAVASAKALGWAGA